MDLKPVVSKRQRARAKATFARFISVRRNRPSRAELMKLIDAAQGVLDYFVPVIDETYFDIQERELFLGLERSLAPVKKKTSQSN